MYDPKTLAPKCDSSSYHGGSLENREKCKVVKSNSMNHKTQNKRKKPITHTR